MGLKDKLIQSRKENYFVIIKNKNKFNQRLTSKKLRYERNNLSSKKFFTTLDIKMKNFNNKSHISHGIVYENEKTPSEYIEHTVDELNSQSEARKKYSRRRKYRMETDVDSINNRNTNFNNKLARAFNHYTREIKGNLERGTALYYNK